MALARFRVKAEAGEPAVIEVNGQLLDGSLAVLGLSLRADGPAPVLTLMVAGDGVLEGEGIVQVERAGTEDYRAELRAIVEAIDEQEWERKALEHSPSLESTMVAGFKGALLEMLSP